MMRFLKKNEKTVTFLFCLLGAFVLTGLMLLLLALLLYKLKVPKWVIGVGIIMIYVAGCMWGGFTLGKRMKEKKFLWGLFLGAVYFCILLLVSLFTNGGLAGDFGNLLLSMVLCMLGGMLGGMLG